MTQGYGPQDGQPGQWGQNGQWGQDGQPGQDPQQPVQQPQWGQPSPAPAAPQWGQQPSAPAPQQGEQAQWGGQPSAQPQPAASPAQPQWGGQSSAPQASPAPQQQWSQSSPPPAPGGYPGTSGYPGAAGASAGLPGTGGTSTLGKLVSWMFYAVLAVVAVRLIGNVIVFAIQFAGGATGSTATAGVGTAFGIVVLLVNGLVTLALLVLAVMVAIQAKSRGRTGAIIILATVVLAVIAYWFLYGILLGVAANADYSTFGVVSLIYLVVEIIRSLIVFAALIVGGLMSRRWAKQNA